MMNIVEFTTLDVILLLFNIALILIRLHILEKKVKELEGRLSWNDKRRSN